MLYLEKDEFNEVTYQFIHALLYKITDSLLSISYSPEKNKLDVTAYFDLDKISDLDRELMIGFETEVKNRLSSYEIKLMINEVSADDFSKYGLSLSNVLFLRFNKSWW